MWKAVVNSINLSDAQRGDVVSWKQLFLQKVEPIVEERKKLNVQIQAHLPQVRVLVWVLSVGGGRCVGGCVSCVGGVLLRGQEGGPLPLITRGTARARA